MCAGIILPAFGQEKTYTVEQCNQMALEHNAKIKNARNNIEGAQQTNEEAFTNFFPTVSASGMGFDATKDMAFMSLAPGMDMSLMKNGVVGAVTATQPIFAGGQIINSNKLAKVGIEVSKLQLEQSKNEVKLTSEQYFWQVITLQEKLRTVFAIDSMLQRLCKDVEVAVNAGIITRNDLLQVQLKRNETESNRINLENNIEISKILLAQYIGVADSTNFKLTADIPMGTSISFPSQIYRNPTVALPMTPEYQLLQENVKVNKLQHKIAVGKNLPTVGVGAGYMYHNVLDNDRSFGMIFASVSVPISGWWGGNHSIKRQKLQVQNAENDMTNKSELLVINMQKVWIDVENAYKQLGVAVKSIEQSTENLRLNNEYYKAGTTKLSDLLDAQTMYQQSRDKYVDAYSSYQIKVVEYMQATGR